jgi:hypothetical protein
LQQEIALLQPQMELAVEDARTPVRELRKDLCGQQKVLRQQGEKLKKQSRLQQEQLKKNQQRLKIELDHMRQSQAREFDI